MDLIRNEQTPLLAELHSGSQSGEEMHLHEEGLPSEVGKARLVQSPTSPLRATTASEGLSMSSPRSDAWKIIQHKLSEGDFLLEGEMSSSTVGTTSDNSTTERKRSQFASQARYQEIQSAMNEIRQGIQFRPWHCLVAILIYLGISVVCYNAFLQPEWTILDTLYFAVVTFTTLGYGDQVPLTEASMMFTCWYALIGVSCLGVALGILGSNLMDAQEKMTSRADNMLKFEVMSTFGGGVGSVEGSQLDRGLISAVSLTGKAAVPGSSGGPNPSKAIFASNVRRWLITFIPIIGLLFGLAYWIGEDSGWDTKETLYYLIVTAFTIGYGDLTPTSDKGKLIALIFIPLAVGTTGVWLGSVANWILEARSAGYRRQLGLQELTQRHLDIMDTSGDGKVSRAEFLEFMLVAMNKMDRELVDELRHHFNRLDVAQTGELSKVDLVESARRKLQSPAYKLRLAVYKDELKRKAARR